MDSACFVPSVTPATRLSYQRRTLRSVDRLSGRRVVRIRIDDAVTTKHASAPASDILAVSERTSARRDIGSAARRDVAAATNTTTADTPLMNIASGSTRVHSHPHVPTTMAALNDVRVATAGIVAARVRQTQATAMNHAPTKDGSGTDQSVTLVSHNLRASERAGGRRPRDSDTLPAVATLAVTAPTVATGTTGMFIAGSSRHRKPCRRSVNDRRHYTRNTDAASAVRRSDWRVEGQRRTRPTRRQCWHSTEEPPTR